jgi:hypothetical protein
MSRNHVVFLKQDESPSTIRYAVSSPDLKSDQSLGTLVIDTDNAQFTFTASGALATVLFIPPEVWDLPEQEQEILIKQQYRSSEHGGLSRLIAKTARRLMRDRTFPSEASGVT